jgi:hypothetical protein
MTGNARLDALLPPDPAGYRAEPTLAITAGQIPSKLPRHLADRLAEAAVAGQRSEQTAGLVAAAVEWGLDDGQVVALALSHRPTVEKYGRRADREAVRVLTKIRPAHQHIGQPCDRAGCVNKPSWMIGEQILPTVVQHRSSNSSSTGQSEGPSLAEQFDAKLLSFADLFNLPAPNPLIDELLYRDTVTVVYGPSGVGKTFLVLDLAWCVAGGYPWQGREVHGGPVLYVLGEGRGGIGPRARAWLAGHQGIEEPKQFRLYPEPVNLLDSNQVGVLVAWANVHRPVMVVIDTLARSMPGGDENSARDMGLAISAADAIRRASEACVVIVHHTGKDGMLERGSSALRAGADTVIPVKAAGRSVTVGGTDAKQKDADPGPEIQLELVPVDLDDGSSSCVLRAFARLQERTALDRHKEAILRILADDFSEVGASNKTLRETLNLNESQTSRAVNALAKADAIVNYGSRTRPHWRVKRGGAV